MRTKTCIGVIAVIVVVLSGVSIFVDGASGQETPPAATQTAAQQPAQPPGQQPLDKPDPVPAQSADDAVASEAQAYARSAGISQGEAVRRLRIQRDMGPLIERLRNAHQDRLAGVVVDHAPTYRLRVRLTGDAPVAARKEALGGSELPVAFETGAKATLESLRTSLRANQVAVARLYPTLAGIGIDESTSEIVVTVFAKEAAAEEAARGKFAEVQKVLGAPARIEFTTMYPEMHDVRGGSRLVSSANYLCTSAFVVKNTSTGVTGVTTAGHCDNSQTYYNPNGTSIPLTLVSGSEFYDSDQDVQVHTSAYVERPEFYWDDAKTTPRVLSGRRLRSSTAYNDNVCHRGETTGYSCGYVQRTDYAPYNPTTPLCGGSCAAVYIRVTGTSLECAGGDSGGPWFASTVAFGIHKGGASSGTGPGQCTEAFYMTTDTISPGWSLLYGP
jgi:streptogrisin C